LNLSLKYNIISAYVSVQRWEPTHGASKGIKDGAFR